MIVRLMIVELVYSLSKNIQVAESDGVPPLPIPNREVKPVHADGTA